MRARRSASLAEQLLAAISRPFVVDGHELFMTASAGIAVFPDDGAHAGQLLRNADTAMHRAKDAGGNCTRLYDTGTNELAQMHLARRSELHNALRRDELRVLYQPQIDLRTGHIVGVEALVRWEHPALGLLTPADFVPLAEESDLVIEVDTWVMRHACAQAVAWDQEGLPPLRMAANLSGRNFSDDRIIGRVATVLRDSGLAAPRLELEITESLALRESEGALDIIRRVRDLGVRFAIDDFGTGYSALAQMQRFPVDRLKIDRTFVNQITSAQGVAPLVSAFIGIARGAAPRSRCRGCRDPGTTDVPPHPRLQRGPGLPLQPARAPRRGGGACPQAVVGAARGGPGRLRHFCGRLASPTDQ